VKIPGGCPDGFWSLTNCDKAAQLGLCSVSTRTDDRIVTVDDEVAAVTRPKVIEGGEQS
jgi:hypothetical protein